MTFLVISVVILNASAWFIPKKISGIEMWSSSLFASVLQFGVDTVLDLKFDMYGYFNKGVDWGGMLASYGLYPSASLLFLNYYPFERSKIRKTFYILAWSASCVLYEIISIKAGFFYHRTWRTWYSALVYPALLYILVLDLKFIRWLMERHTVF